MKNKILKVSEIVVDENCVRCWNCEHVRARDNNLWQFEDVVKWSDIESVLGK